MDEVLPTMSRLSQLFHWLEGPSPLADPKATQLSALSPGWVSTSIVNVLEQFAVPAVVGLLALLAAYFLAKLVARQVRYWVCGRVDETLGKFASRVSFYGILLLAATITLPAVGIQVSGLMAVLATAGFAIGLAFQGTLSNFSAGILLLVFRPFKVGDLVNIAGITGKVNEIDLFTTTLDTLDNRRMILPNSSIAGNTIENMTFHEHRRVEVSVGVDRSASLDATRAALTACAESMADLTIPGEGRGYQVRLNNISESSLIWSVRLWVDKDQFFPATERLTCEIKRHLDHNQIGIAFPQMRLHLSSPGSANATISAVELNNAFESSQAGKPKRVDSDQSDASLKIPNLLKEDDRPTSIRPRIRGENLDRAGQTSFLTRNSS